MADDWTFGELELTIGLIAQDDDEDDDLDDDDDDDDDDDNGGKGEDEEQDDDDYQLDGPPTPPSRNVDATSQNRVGWRRCIVRTRWGCRAGGDPRPQLVRGTHAPRARRLIMALEPGTTLGPYEVTAKIGEGGMGEVYRARDTKLDRDVALKVLPQAFTDDPDRLARFGTRSQSPRLAPCELLDYLRKQI